MDDEVEEIEVAEEPEIEEIEEESSEIEPDEESDEESTLDEESEESEEEGELVIEIEGESPTPEESEKEEAPGWVKELRKSHRETQKENKALKERLNALEKPAEEARVVLGEKPTLESSDYDADKYASDLAAWYEKKEIADKQEKEAKAQEQQAQQAWNTVLQSYEEKKESLNVRDYFEAEELVQESLSVTQQGMVLQGAENPALVVYALGKNPGKAKEFAEIKDPVKFAFAVAKFEGKLKVGNRKVQVKPEKKISGSAKSSIGDSKLEKLRAEAKKTGNFDKVTAYRRKLEQAKRK